MDKNSLTQWLNAKIPEIINCYSGGMKMDELITNLVDAMMSDFHGSNVGHEEFLGMIVNAVKNNGKLGVVPYLNERANIVKFFVFNEPQLFNVPIAKTGVKKDMTN